MRATLLAALAILASLALAGPAFAEPHLSKAQTKQVAGLVDRFIKDVVLARNLPDGWRISGPQVRGGTTEKAWDAGRALPVQRLPLVGTNWSHAWYATCVGATGVSACEVPHEIGLTVNLRTGHGRNAEVYDQELVLDRIHGKWLVNAWYTNAEMRIGKGHRGSCIGSKCSITGLNDFAAGSGGGDAEAPARLGSDWLGVTVGGIAAVPIVAFLAFFLYGRLQKRRAWQAYVNTKRT
jgi:hypothetical protein